MDDMKFLAACEIIRCWNQWPPARGRRWLGGRRLGLLLIAGLLPLSAAAVECSESRPERFAEFFKTFASDTRFAVARTVLPLLTERWSDDDWFDELAKPADVWITPEDYARRPSLQSRSTAQHLVLQVGRRVRYLALRPSAGPRGAKWLLPDCQRRRPGSVATAGRPAVRRSHPGSRLRCGSCSGRLATGVALRRLH